MLTAHCLHSLQYVQLKNGLKEVDELRLIMEQRASELWYTLNLPDNVPECRRLKQYIADSDMKQNAKRRGYISSTVRLYLKYIDPEEAYLEVNLSSKVKKELIAAFKTIKLTLEPFEVILPLLDKAAIEVSKLMRDSFGRFRATDVFRKLEESQRKRSQSS